MSLLLKRIILHIGTEKTASTSLQHFLRHSDTLLLDMGFYYPQSLGQYNHRDLSACMLDDVNSKDDHLELMNIDSHERLIAFRERTIEALGDEIDSLPPYVHTLIISSEHFHSRLLTFSCLERLKLALLSLANDVKIIMYVREQSAMCKSFYSTVLKSGGVVSWGEHVNRCTRLNPYYNHLVTYQLWSSCFGSNALTIRRFAEPEHDSSFDIVKDFVDSWDGGVLRDAYAGYSARNRRTNLSLSNEGLRIMTLLNELCAMYKSDPLARHRHEYAAIISNSFAGSPSLITANQQARIFSEFYEDNKILASFVEGIERGQPLFPALKSCPLSCQDESALHESDDTTQLRRAFHSLLLVVFKATVTRFESRDQEMAHKLIKISSLLHNSSPELALELLDLVLEIRPSFANIVSGHALSLRSYLRHRVINSKI